ncbi:MAG: SAM-dependent chlorinase/fluorinase [Gammaproteobacteria bacterium]|nr:SAM-dependent chlorinase/fluorinase [Gammaproteobacteria bacterium]
MPRSVVTLTTDFGHAEPYVAMMKGVILTRAPGTQLIDISHDIPTGQAEIAGFWLRLCLSWFPSGTVHLAVVDPGVGTPRRLLAAEFAGQLLLAPDNGLLGPVVARHPQVRLREIDLDALDGLLPAQRSSTFHGRDILAPLAGELAAGRVYVIGLGQTTDEHVNGSLPAPEARDGVIHGQVIVADRWGNLLTNIERPRAAQPGSLRINVAGREFALADTYADVPVGEPCALINAHGLVEVAVHQGSAAARLEIGPGAAVSVTGAEIPAPRPGRPGRPQSGGGRPAGARPGA